jgi:hypothetical protein
MQFNVMRGVLPGGRHGVVFHGLVAVPVVFRDSRWVADTAAGSVDRFGARRLVGSTTRSSSTRSGRW